MVEVRKSLPNPFGWRRKGACNPRIGRTCLENLDVLMIVKVGGGYE